MNKARRVAIQEIISRIEACSDALDNILSDEEDYLDNIPENLQTSDKFEKAEAAVDNLEEAVDDLSSAVEHLEDAMS